MNKTFEEKLLENIDFEKVYNFVIFTYSIDKIGIEFIKNKNFGNAQDSIIFVGDDSGYRKVHNQSTRNIYILPLVINNNKFVSHAKLYIFRMKNNKYLLTIGSANLNENSLTQNREFISFFKSDDNPHIFEELNDFLKSFHKNYINSCKDIPNQVKEIFQKFYKNMDRHIKNKSHKKDRSIRFIHSLEKPIIKQLPKNSKFIKIVSPSFDKDRNIFEETHNFTSNIKQIYTADETVEHQMGDDFGSKLNNIKNRYLIEGLHGKFYEFNNGWRLFGSPNFTCAGLCGSWLDNSGNLETAILYKNEKGIKDLIKANELNEIEKFTIKIPEKNTKEEDDKVSPLIIRLAKHNQIVGFDKPRKIKFEIYYEQSVNIEDYELFLKLNEKINNRLVFLSNKIEVETNEEIKKEVYDEIIEGNSVIVVKKEEKEIEECGITIISEENQAKKGEISDISVDPLDAFLGRRLMTEVKYKNEIPAKREDVDRSDTGSTEEFPKNYSEYRARTLALKMKEIKRRIIYGDEKSIIDDIAKDIEKWDYYNNAEKLFIVSVLRDIDKNEESLKKVYNDLKSRVKWKAIQQNEVDKKIHGSSVKVSRFKNDGLSETQKELVEYVWKNFYKKGKGGVLIADRVGSGKSYEALEIVRKLYAEGKKGCLIVVPRFLVSEWIMENEEFQKCKCNNKKDIEEIFKKLKEIYNDGGHIYKYIYIQRNEFKKKKNWKILKYFLNAHVCENPRAIESNGINIVSLSKLSRFNKRLPRISSILIDEIQYFKGGTKHRYDALERTIKRSRKEPFRIFLSGTPFEVNIPEEAYRILRLLLRRSEMKMVEKEPPSKCDENSSASEPVRKLINIYCCLKKIDRMCRKVKSIDDPKEIARLLMIMYIIADLDYTVKDNDDDIKKKVKNINNTEKEKGLDELLRYFMARQLIGRKKISDDLGFASKHNQIWIDIEPNTLFETLNLRAEVRFREKKDKIQNSLKKEPGGSTFHDLIKFTSAFGTLSKNKRKEIFGELWNIKAKKDIDCHYKFNRVIKEIINQVSDKTKDWKGERVIVFVNHRQMARLLRDFLNEKFKNGKKYRISENDKEEIRSKIKDPKKRKYKDRIIENWLKYSNLLGINYNDSVNKFKEAIENKKKSIEPKSLYLFDFAEIYHIPKKKNARHIKDIKDYFTNSKKIFPRVLIFVKKGTNGINIQRDCRKLIHYNLDFNPGILEQREGRVNRPGHKNGKVVIRAMVLKNSYDHEILARAVLRMKLIDLLGGFARFWAEKNIEALVDKIFLTNEENNANIGKRENIYKEIKEEINTLQKQWKVKDVEIISKDGRKKWGKKVTFSYLTKYVFTV